VAGDETVGTLSTLRTLETVGTLSTLRTLETVGTLSTLRTLETVGTLSRAVLTSCWGGAGGGSATQVRGHVSALAERSRLLPSRLGGSTTAGLLGGQALSPATTTTTSSSSSSSSSGSSSSSSSSSSWARGEVESGRGTLGSRFGDETTTRFAGIASGLGLFLALLLLFSNLVEFAIHQC
jgi:hypothetical protein